jgi:hypothetical protein
MQLLYVIWRVTWSPSKVVLCSKVLSIVVRVHKIWISLYTQNGKDKNQGHGIVLKMRIVELAGTYLYSYIVIGVEVGLNGKPEGS